MGENYDDDELIGSDKSPILSRKISSHIELRLENDQTKVYIDGEYVETCMDLKVIIPKDLLNELYSLLSDTPPEFKNIAGFLMFDLIFLDQGLKPDVVRPNDNLIKTIRI